MRHYDMPMPSTIYANPTIGLAATIKVNKTKHKKLISACVIASLYARN